MGELIPDDAPGSSADSLTATASFVPTGAPVPPEVIYASTKFHFYTRQKPAFSTHDTLGGWFTAQYNFLRERWQWGYNIPKSLYKAATGKVEPIGRMYKNGAYTGQNYHEGPPYKPAGYLFHGSFHLFGSPQGRWQWKMEYRIPVRGGTWILRVSHKMGFGLRRQRTTRPGKPCLDVAHSD